MLRMQGRAISYVNQRQSFMLEAHTEITLTLRRIATKSHKNKKNKKDDRQLKTVSYLCCMKEESVCRGGKPEISQAQRLLSV